MNRYKQHLADHFRSCMLLAKAYDPHRERQVQIKAIPGMFDVVGVTDGVDAWVAPALPSLFSVNVQRILHDLQNGKMPSVNHSTASRPRTRVLAAPMKEPEQAQPPAPAPRVRVLVQQESTRRVNVRP